MSYSLRGTHLLRQFLLFAITALLILTVLRAGYALHFFPNIQAFGNPVGFFLQGARFDLALIGAILAVPVVIGSLLSMFDFSRALASWFINIWLFLGLVIILFLELITPLFLLIAGVRPGMSDLDQLSNPALLNTAINRWNWQFGVAAILILMILIAFCFRLEIMRFLRYKVTGWQALLVAVFGGALCAFAIWSQIDENGPLTRADASISDDALVNELVLNTGWKTLLADLPQHLRGEALAPPVNVLNVSSDN